jgi:hypothetical protein
MKKNFSLMALLVAGASVLFTSCDKSKDPTPTTTTGSKEVVIKSNIPVGVTRHLVADSTYVLQGNIFVKGTIKIDAGTIIKGDKLTKGTLIVLQGGKIDAQGTSTKPIVFTSRMEAGLRAAGDWGGVILVGKAPVNQSSATVEGLTQTLKYGLDTIPASQRDVNDNSGIMQYVRIEFAGIALQPDNEINGLTFCSVGAGTTVDHIQVSFSGDDSYEWFGGNVKAKYLIAYCGLDDDFDTDYGFSGKVQYALGVRSARIADVSTSNGFESDNDATGSVGQPKTKGVFSNVTLIGPYKTTADGNVSSNFGAGAHIRRNSSLSIINCVFAGWNTAGIKLDGDLTYANAKDSLTLNIKNCAIIGNKASTAIVGVGTNCTNTTALALYNTSAYSNMIIATNATAKIAANAKDSAGVANSFYISSKTGSAAIPTSFLPASNSPLLTGAFDVSTLNSFFEKTSYIGAFGTTDWTKEAWVNFDPQNTVY